MTELGQGRNELYLLSRLQRQTRGWFASNIAAYDMTVPMFRVMFEINFGPDDITASELARRTFVSVQTVNLVVQNLTERGFVDRNPTGHGRRLALTLTDAGQAMLADLRAEHSKVIDAMTATSGITAHEVRDVLTRMILSVEHAMAEADAQVDADGDEGDPLA